VLRRMGTADHLTEVYLRQAGETWEVVGVRRSASGMPSAPPVWTQLPVEL